MKAAAVGVATVAIVGAVAAVTIFLLREDEISQPAIMLQVPAQIGDSDPLQFEPDRTEECSVREVGGSEAFGD